MNGLAQFQDDVTWLLNRTGLSETLTREALARMQRFGLALENMGNPIADARALWSVRVLDAWRRETGCNWTTDGVYWVCCTHTGAYLALDAGTDEDAARHAAALAVFATLPDDVRAKLGECP